MQNNTHSVSIQDNKLNIAVIGSGISGLSAAWLLSHKHNVTVYEANAYLGGHSNTVEIISAGKTIAVDTGFIVYNEPAYPNLVRLFDELSVETYATEMSFAVSVDKGKLEYAGNGLGRLFAQKSNLFKPSFWSMIKDIKRFYTNAPSDAQVHRDITLGDYLKDKGYSQSFCENHLYPMAAAIWSIPALKVGDYPFSSFVNFCVNHGLLQIGNRPIWRTVKGGSREYVSKVSQKFKHNIKLNNPVMKIKRYDDYVEVISKNSICKYDHVVISSHADQALSLIEDPSQSEMAVLGSFQYSNNYTVLHSDSKLMPKDKKVWSSWNYLSYEKGLSSNLTVTYWMNSLQNLNTKQSIFVSLNPVFRPEKEKIYREFSYDHPIFDTKAIAAQKKIWSLQGSRRTWFCGSYHGFGFHEDGLQSGLAVAEKLSGLKRPWRIPEESNRIAIDNNQVCDL
jgi:uncharacterized protein